MFGSEGSGIPDLRVPLGLNLKQAHEPRRGNAIHQLQQNYHALSNEVAHISTDLREVLAHLREDLGGGPRRTRGPQRGDFSPIYSSSSQDDDHPRRERRPPSP